MALGFQHLAWGLCRRLANFISPPAALYSSWASAYYPQQPTCQIPNLYYLLSKYFGCRDDGFYVEVGAYDGLFASNTWGLAQRGWHGLLIEPIPPLADKCRRNYARFERIQVLQVAAGDCQKAIPLHLAGTLTTANSGVYKEYANVEWARRELTTGLISVECRTLDQILTEQQIPRGFDLLVVDVEGFEAEVFAGFDLSTWMPKMLIVELLDTHPDLTSTQDSDARLSRTLSAAGYVICFKDWINTVLVREDVWESSLNLTLEHDI